MKARVKWVEDVMFLGESGTGHTVVMDGPEEAGGHGTGMRPMELLLLGMGGSSLCPEVLAQIFGAQPGSPRLHVLDSTVPAQLRDLDGVLGGQAVVAFDRSIACAAS